jgi:sortase A
MTATTTRQGEELRLAGQALAVLAVLALGFLAQLAVFGALEHDREQAVRHDEFRRQLALATAPVGPLGDDGRPLPPGTPIAILEVPRLGIQEVVGEGTSSRVLMSGPGHRRDTVLPGQAGASVIMGRRAAYGGPFASLSDMRRGDEIIVTTGQGRHTYRTIGVRRAGEPLPPTLSRGQGRLTLMTADGPAFLPTDVLRVDADLTGDAQQAGAQLPSGSLPDSEQALAGDSSALIPVVLWAQALLAAAIGVVWLRHRQGGWPAWVVGVPVLAALGVAAADQLAALLPNLL